jgi:methylated-DNA-[protein]-cysteine S-methyltransferase
MAKKSGRAKPEALFISRYDSPLGRYVLVTSSKGIVCLEPEEHGFLRIARWKKEGLPIEEDGSKLRNRVLRELEAYFGGKLKKFTLPLDLRGTPFQKAVWEALLRIPYGETRSYSDIAQAIGKPAATRAVGLANGANPVSLIVPCHRVIGKSGDLVGYGGGLERKRTLLELEARG